MPGDDSLENSSSKISSDYNKVYINSVSIYACMNEKKLEHDKKVPKYQKKLKKPNFGIYTYSDVQALNLLTSEERALLPRDKHDQAAAAINTYKGYNQTSQKKSRQKTKELKDRFGHYDPNFFKALNHALTHQSDGQKCVEMLVEHNKSKFEQDYPDEKKRNLAQNRLETCFKDIVRVKKKRYLEEPFNESLSIDPENDIFLDAPYEDDAKEEKLFAGVMDSDLQDSQIKSGAIEFAKLLGENSIEELQGFKIVYDLERKRIKESLKERSKPGRGRPKKK
jgi:hypothetical protein